MSVVTCFMAPPAQVMDSSWRTADTDSIETARAIADNRSPADYRLENARLRLQVAVLERELERSAQNRQAVIDQYEALLSEREAELDTGQSRLDRDGSTPLRRLIEFCR